MNEACAERHVVTTGFSRSGERRDVQLRKGHAAVGVGACPVRVGSRSDERGCATIGPVARVTTRRLGQVPPAGFV